MFLAPPPTPGSRRSAPLRARVSLHSRVILPILLLALVGAVACEDAADRRLEQARAFQSAGQFEQAIEVLRTIVADDETNPEAQFLLGKALLQTGRPNLAVSALDKAAGDSFYARPAGLLLASTLSRAQRYEEAAVAADRVLAIDPTNRTALFTRGQARVALGQATLALEDADAILAESPDAQNAIMLKGRALIDLERRDEAEQVWVALRTRMAAGGNPDRAARACGLLALFYRTQEELDRAEATYAECLEAHPNHVQLQQRASDFYLRSGAPDRAIEIYRKALEANPEDIRLWGRLANLLFTYGAPGDAQRTLEETVERLDTPEAWRLLAGFHRKSGDSSAAREALEEAIDRADGAREAYLFSLAELLIEEGELERAREIGEGLSEASYRHLLEGAILLSSKNPERALREFDAGLTLWPNNPYAHDLAGQAALELNDLPRAVSEFREALRVSESSTDAALRLAEIYFASGNHNAAWVHAQQQINHRPYTGVRPYQIAIQSALALDEPGRALRVVEALRAAEPDGLSALVEMSEIKRRTGGPKAASEYILESQRDLSAPENEPLLRALAGDLNTLGREDEGLAHIDAALERTTKTAALHDLRARTLAHLERFSEARVSVDRALALDPTFAPSLEIKAFLALRAGDRATALSALDMAADAERGNAEFAYGAAQIAREMGDQAGTIARLEEALKRQPNYGPAANDLAWILATEQRDLDRALALARVAVRRDVRGNALDTLGWVQYQRGDYAEAIASYRAALEGDANLPAVRYRLGLSLAAIGEVDEARRLLDEIVAGPEFPELEQARAELARIQGS